MNPQLAAALAQAKQTNQAVPVNMGTYTLMAYPNGQVGPQGGGGTARWTPQQTPQVPQQPVQPSNPFNAAGVQGLPGGPSGQAVSPPSSAATTGNPATYTDPITLQSFSSVPATGAVVASGPGYGTGTVIPQTSTSGPAGSTGPVDRHDDPVAAQARVYRINHGIATPDDSAATDALNAESLAAANAGRTYLNRDLAAQYGQPQAAGVSGPRTDVVNALLMPPSTTGTAYAQQQPIVLAPTTTAPQQPYPLTYTGGVPTNLTAPASSGGAMPTVTANLLDPRVQANSLLTQGIY